MDLPPGFKRFLDRIGVSSTWVQWRLHEWERRREQRAAGVERGPGRMGWVKYNHKFCPSCGRLASRDDTVCVGCGARLPSVAGYKFQRLLTTVLPDRGAIWGGFFFFMIAFYVFAVAKEGIGPKGFGGMLLDPSPVALMRYGVLSIAAVDAGQWWRVLSCGLMHIGLLHLAFNSFALYQMGPLLEPAIGPRRMFVLISLSQVASGLAIHRFSDVGAAGASGWICGLIGFGIVYAHRRGRGAIGIRDALLRWAIFIFFFGLAVGGISNSGHLGGMAGGAALGCAMDMNPHHRWLTRLWNAAVWPCAALWGYTLLELGKSIFGP